MEKSIFYTFRRQINIQRYGNDFLPKWRNKKEKIFYENVFLINLFQPNTEVGAIITQTLDVGSIRSVKVAKEGRRNIPKAFEIFTEDRTFILKAKDGSNAQEWVQCLSVAKAHSQVCYFSDYFLDFVMIFYGHILSAFEKMNSYLLFYTKYWKFESNIYFNRQKTPIWKNWPMEDLWAV